MKLFLLRDFNYYYILLFDRRTIRSLKQISMNTFSRYYSYVKDGILTTRTTLGPVVGLPLVSPRITTQLTE